MHLDYSIFYKRKFSSTLQLTGDVHYDLFLSAYNDSRRVKDVFRDIDSQEKHWLIFPEYGYKKSEEPVSTTDSEKIFTFDIQMSEGEIIRKYLADCGIDFIGSHKICVDITGFIRPHLIFLVRYLSLLGVGNIDFLYTDPVKYVKGENTDFSFDYTNVRQIDGCQGAHNPETINDILIIGAGYDHLRIVDVSKNKDNTKKVQLFGLPSLQPDMYQENILKAYRASEETVSRRQDTFIDEENTLFAPANDPFVTANVLSDFVRKQNRIKPITNLYLCPLSTKAQTLGTVLYFISGCSAMPTSIIFPICGRYSKETTEGISKIWKYTVEFQSLK